MSKMKLTPSTPGTDSGSQTLFDQLGSIATVKGLVATSALTPAEQATLEAQLDGFTVVVNEQIASNIEAYAASGQSMPDVVVALDGSGWAVNATANPITTRPAVVVNASDIPLAATPPAPAASPGS